MWHELIAARSIACCCALLSGSCAAAGAGGTTATPNPASAGWLTPSGTWISEVSGKMNVPKPSAKFYTGHPLFLWPGLFISPGPHEGYPDRKAMGLFQPVLTLGQGCSSSIGCGPDQPWTIANWYSNCTGSKPDAADYCHDAYQSVQAGDTLSWYMRRVVSSTAFPMQYEMGWSSALNTSQSSRPFVQTISAGPVFIWAIEAEPWFAINNATVDPSYDMLPQSPYRVWDVVVKDQHGTKLDPEWKCGAGSPPAITLDCQWAGPTGETGFSMEFGSSYTDRAQEGSPLAKVGTLAPLKHDDEGQDACDKHTGQCCHHACKMTNWPCCHHGEHCCCGGPPRRISNCSNDEYRPFQPFPIPTMPAPAPPSAPPAPRTQADELGGPLLGGRNCCFFANFTECDATPSKSCETVPCIKGVTCPVHNTSSPHFSGNWCNAKVWYESCRMGWTHGCSCNVTNSPS